MNKVKEILGRKGKAVSDSRIQEKLTEYELDGSNLSDVDAETLASELEPEAKPIGGLATSNGSQATKSEPTPRKPRKSAKQVALEKAITHAAKQTDLEVESLETVIRTQKTTYVDNRATSLVNEIRNTSTEIVESVTDKLLQEVGDPDSFRQIGEIFSEALFPSVGNA